MNIGLFDLYTSGHHLPYAYRIKQAIDRTPDTEVTFITLSETDQCSDLFDRSELEFLDDPESPRIEDREGQFVDLSNRLVGKFLSSSAPEKYDVIHFLFADDILGPLWKHCSTSMRPRLISELNGNFFKRGSPLRRQYLHPLFLQALRSPAGVLIDSAVPKLSPHQSLWRDLYLYRCLRDGSFDHLLTHSQEASKYASQMDVRRITPITNVPYLAPDAFGNEISKSEARDRLDLHLDNPILLFLGTLRSEKGIHGLLEALREYRGPEFTMVIAGPPISVTEAEIRSTVEKSTVDIVPDLEYVRNPEVYYRAADALILPYVREFGKECTSQTLGESCSAMRPVIVPDCGVVGRLTREWNLGTTYDRGSTEALTEAMVSFASEGVSYSREQMERYNRRHSIENVSDELVSIYAVDTELG